jgi:hypothetical protein
MPAILSENCFSPAMGPDKNRAQGWLCGSIGKKRRRANWNPAIAAIVPGDLEAEQIAETGHDCGRGRTGCPPKKREATDKGAS